jgi:pimeloyl-ACP methyl ester carboxylesterase
MTGKILLMPDYGLHGHEYFNTIRAFSASGFDVATTSPPWKASFKGVMKYVQHEVDDVLREWPILFGHAHGGDLALRAAAQTQRHLGGIIVTSPGILSANGLQFPQGLEAVNKQFPGQQGTVEEYDLEMFAENTNLDERQIAVLIGEREAKKFPYMQKLAQETAKAFDVGVTIVPDAPHAIEYSNPYIRAVVTAAMGIHMANLGE